MKIEHKDRGWKVTDEKGNKTYFGEYGVEGANEGVIFKDYNAFETGEGVCYINEYGFENSEQNDCELFEFEDKEQAANEIVNNPYWAKEGYTRKDFIKLCKSNEKMAKNLFDMCDWTCPETILDQWEYEDFLPEDLTLNKEEDLNYTDSDEDLEQCVSDYLSDEYGYCHNGFKYIDNGDTIKVYDIEWDLEED